MELFAVENPPAELRVGPVIQAKKVPAAILQELGREGSQGVMGWVEQNSLYHCGFRFGSVGGGLNTGKLDGTCM